MAGAILTRDNPVTCDHGGQATPAAVDSRVLIGGAAAVTQDQVWAITGCSLAPADGGPCVSATFSAGASRITSNGQVLLLQDSPASCAPTGGPVHIVASQSRVTGT